GSRDESRRFAVADLSAGHPPAEPARSARWVLDRPDDRDQRLHDTRAPWRATSAGTAHLHRAADPLCAAIWIRRHGGHGAPRNGSPADDRFAESDRGTAVTARWIFRIVVVVVFAFLLMPIFYVVLSSFNQSPALPFPPASFTTDWYRRIPQPF